MLKFCLTMDPHSLAVERLNPAKHGIVDGSSTCIGHIMWYPNRDPQFVALVDFLSLTLSELQQLAARLAEASRKGA